VTRSFGDLDLAEESVQEAFIAALERWPKDGMPRVPGAWITTTARRKAIDRLRRERVFEAKSHLLAADGVEPDPGAEEVVVPDDRLALIFMCCHPALPADGQVALTLRAVGGLTTREIGRAFLVPEATMAQRITRAKRKIKRAGVPFAVPAPGILSERRDQVLHVLYLIFNEGYTVRPATGCCAPTSVSRPSASLPSSWSCCPMIPRRVGCWR
jgi:RNA polymerase sigma-70 factor, ECF subfamily